MIIQNKESSKRVCKKCGGIGHFSSHEPARVVRKYCDCETGKKRKKFIEEQTKIKDVEPVWELLTI